MATIDRAGIWERPSHQVHDSLVVLEKGFVVRDDPVASVLVIQTAKVGDLIGLKAVTDEVLLAYDDQFPASPGVGVGEEVLHRLVEAPGIELDVVALVDDERIEGVLLQPLALLVFLLGGVPPPYQVGAQAHDGGGHQHDDDPDGVRHARL
jgi:hypothetical protein